MKQLFAILLLLTATTVTAEPRTRTIRFMCGSFEDVQATMDKYGEKLIIASLAPNKETVNMLWVNLETQTSSWFVHDLKTNEYCMMGVGDNLLIPKESPLNSELGTKTTYK
jgi:hypothetical protein